MQFSQWNYARCESSAGRSASLPGIPIFSFSGKSKKWVLPESTTAPDAQQMIILQEISCNAGFISKWLTPAASLPQSFCFLPAPTFCANGAEKSRNVFHYGVFGIFGLIQKKSVQIENLCSSVLICGFFYSVLFVFSVRNCLPAPTFCFYGVEKKLGMSFIVWDGDFRLIQKKSIQIENLCSSV